jgi:hypothetical protein
MAGQHGEAMARDESVTNRAAESRARAREARRLFNEAISYAQLAEALRDEDRVDVARIGRDFYLKWAADLVRDGLDPRRGPRRRTRREARLLLLKAAELAKSTARHDLAHETNRTLKTIDSWFKRAEWSDRALERAYAAALAKSGRKP